MNTLTKMARELLAIDEDLPFRFKDPYHTRVDYFELYTFEQSWGDTTCGFGGIGGQAITTARTYVFVPVSVDERCYVYIGGRFAYSCEWSELFKKDLMNQNVAGRIHANKYAINKEAQNEASI